MGIVLLALPSDLVEIVVASFAAEPEEVRVADPAALVDADFAGVEAVVVAADARILTASLVAACDRTATRIVPYATDDSGRRLAASFGLAPLTLLQANAIMTHPVAGVRVAPASHITVVWGPHGAPGRSIVAASLATRLAGSVTRVGLIDADTHAPSLAVQLGLHDDGPGFAGACRSASRSALDAAELSRISQPLTLARGVVDVLTGINRPSRWTELSAERVSSALTVTRGWADHVVVDVAASLEQDEEIVNDMVTVRRNAATLASLRAADSVVAICASDPVGVSRFIRGIHDLREVVGNVPIVVVANRARSSVLGMDARGQLRRTLARFGDIHQVVFVPDDPFVVDAALRQGVPVVQAAPKSAFAGGIAALASTLTHSAPEPTPRRVPRSRRRRERIEA